MAARTVPRFGRVGTGDISVGFAVELETTSQFVGLRDTGTGRKLVLLNPNGASRLTIRAG